MYLDTIRLGDIEITEVQKIFSLQGKYTNLVLTILNSDNIEKDLVVEKNKKKINKAIEYLIREDFIYEGKVNLKIRVKDVGEC